VSNTTVALVDDGKVLELEFRLSSLPA